MNNTFRSLALTVAITLLGASPAVAQLQKNVCQDVEKQLKGFTTEQLLQMKKSYEVTVNGDWELMRTVNEDNIQTVKCIDEILLERNKFSSFSKEELKQLIDSYSIKVNGDWELARTINARNAETVELAKKELASRK